MQEAFLNTIKKVHFIGIGGIGVSAIARMMLGRGVAVSGSDRAPSLITERLENLGATVFFGHDASQVEGDVSLVVYSPAISHDNPELVRARELGIPSYSYPEMLGKVSEGLRTVAVSGTHGKTTTTAMIAEMLIAVEKNPTVIVGSLLKSGSNFIPGESNLFVVEACEYKRSFLNLSLEILVITNIDSDHLDYYKDLDDIISAFHELAMKVPTHGFIVADLSNESTRRALEGISAQVVNYRDVLPGTSLKLSVLGEHNERNARAALAVAQILGIALSEALDAVKIFEGTWRRQEYKGETATGALVYDDYAHHPTEIRATLQGFRARFPDRQIHVVFQPHLYSRAKLLLDDFSKSFTDANNVVVAPIYAAREAVDPSITSDILSAAIASQGVPAQAFENFSSIETHLRATSQKGDIILTMGAGDIHKVGEALLS